MDYGAELDVEMCGAEVATASPPLQQPRQPMPDTMASLPMAPSRVVSAP